MRGRRRGRASRHGGEPDGVAVAADAKLTAAATNTDTSASERAEHRSHNDNETADTSNNSDGGDNEGENDEEPTEGGGRRARPETREKMRKRHRLEAKQVDAQVAKMMAGCPRRDPRRPEVEAQAAALRKQTADRHAAESANFVEPTPEKIEEPVIPDSVLNRRLQKQKQLEQQRHKELEHIRRVAELAAQPSPDEIETQQISAHLTPHGFKIFKVPADGSCLFSALADQLTRLSCVFPPGAHDLVKFLRNTAAHYIESHPDLFVGFIESDNPKSSNAQKVQAYCKKIRNGDLWGGQQEIVALANALGCTVHIHNTSETPVIIGPSDDTPHETPATVTSTSSTTVAPTQEQEEANDPSSVSETTPQGNKKKGSTNNKRKGTKLANSTAATHRPPVTFPHPNPVLHISFHLHAYTLGEHYNSVVSL
ncbi:OTU domain-containing protein 6 [Pelomyxa schiedti]|nr:OTU domain-containing protein 6 [Pelomyxa schiedti]